MKKIISYNVNGIRAATRKGLLDWIKATGADILCLQETKAQPDQVPLFDLEALGYKSYWHSAEKKGYSGVLTLTRHTPTYVQAGMGMEVYDREGRVLRTLFGVGKPRGLQGRGGRSAAGLTAGEWAPPHLHPPRRLARLRDRLTRALRHKPHAAVVLVV